MSVKRGLFVRFLGDQTTGSLIGGAMNIVSGAIGAGFQSAQNRKNQQWQEHMQKAQWQAQEYFMDKQNEMNRENTQWAYDRFESPAAQRKAMEAAGINPFAPDGSALQPGASSGAPSVDQGSSGSVPSSDRPSPWNNIQPAFAQATQMFLDAKMKEAEIENIKAKTAREKAETIKVENENSIFPTIKAITESEGLSKKFRAELDEFNAKHAQDRLDIEQGNASASQFASIAAGIAKLEEAATSRVDREWIPKLNEAKIALQEAEARSADASAGLAGEQAETERQLRPERLKEIIANSRNTRLKNILQSVEVQRILDGTDRVTSLFGLVDKFVTETPRQTLRAFGIDNEAEYRKMLLEEFEPYFPTGSKKSSKARDLVGPPNK